MRFKFYAVAILLACFGNCYGQKVDSDSLIDSIKSAITTFFIDEGILDKRAVKNDLNFVFATELKKQKVLGYNNDGIYRIGVLQSHSKQHILIKEDLHFRIFNIKKIHETLKEVIAYSKKHKISVDTMFFYLREIMRMYDNNYHTAVNQPVNGE